MAKVMSKKEKILDYWVNYIEMNKEQPTLKIISEVLEIPVPTVFYNLSILEDEKKITRNRNRCQISSGDLKALAKIERIMQGLSGEEASRVYEWLQSKFNLLKSNNLT